MSSPQTQEQMAAILLDRGKKVIEHVKRNPNAGTADMGRFIANYQSISVAHSKRKYESTRVADAVLTLVTCA
jgi:hypothetical protein